MLRDLLFDAAIIALGLGVGAGLWAFVRDVARNLKTRENDHAHR